MLEVTRPAIVFSVSYIGDLVSATSTFDIISRSAALPRVVAAPGGAALLARDPRVAEVRVVHSSHSLLWRLAVAREIWRARRLGLRVVNLEVYPPRWLFVRTLAQRLGLSSANLDLPELLADNGRSALGQATRHAHRTRYYADAVGAPGATVARLVLMPEEREGVRTRLAALGASQRPLVVVHPGSSEARRRPAVELLASVLNALVAQREAQVVLVGVRSEAALIARLRAVLPDGAALDLCDRLDVRGLAAAIAHADLFVGGDSGPLKIAEAVGARTLSFWSAGAPSASFAGPLGDDHAMLPSDCVPAEAVAAGLRLLMPAR